MANVEINDLTEKGAPDLTDELELQETGGGVSRKATLSNIFSALFYARGRANSSGTLQSGEVGVSSINNPSTGIYDWTLDSAVDSVDTAQLLASAATEGAEIAAWMTSTTVCRVKTTVAGVATDMGHTLIIMKEG